MLTEARLTNFNYCGRSMNKLNVSTDSKNFHRFSPEKKIKEKFPSGLILEMGKYYFKFS